jgi:hypothetical protein
MVAVTAAAGGFLIGGLLGLVVVIAALLGMSKSTGPRQAAAAACGFLVLAALATILEAPLGGQDLSLGYATSRPVAAAAARLAGLALLVAILASAREERSPFALDSPAPRSPSLEVRARRLIASASPALPYAAAVALAAAVRGLTGPGSLSPASVSPVENLQAGLGYAVGTGERLPSAIQPLGPMVAAFAPFSVGAAALVASCLAVLAAMRLGRRLAGRRAAAAVGLLTAPLMVVASPRLDHALAAALVGAGLVLAWPTDLTFQRAVGAGLCLAGAGLARPEAILVVPLVALWAAAVLGRRAMRSMLFLVGAVIVATTPWLVWLQQRFDEWLPGAAVRLAAWPAWLLPFVVACLLALVLRSVAPDGGSDSSQADVGSRLLR